MEQYMLTHTHKHAHFLYKQSHRHILWQVHTHTHTHTMCTPPHTHTHIHIHFSLSVFLKTLSMFLNSLFMIYNHYPFRHSFPHSSPSKKARERERVLKYQLWFWTLQMEVMSMCVARFVIKWTCLLTDFLCVDPHRHVQPQFGSYGGANTHRDMSNIWKGI